VFNIIMMLIISMVIVEGFDLRIKVNKLKKNKLAFGLRTLVKNPICMAFIAEISARCLVLFILKALFFSNIERKPI